MIVLDSSVILKWYLTAESGFEKARHFLEQHQKGVEVIAVPDLVFYEVPNALMTQYKLDAKKATEIIHELFELSFEIHYPDETLYPEMASMTQEYGISFYDAAFVALSEQLQCRFVTADHKLATRLRAFDFVWVI